MLWTAVNWLAPPMAMVPRYSQRTNWGGYKAWRSGAAAEFPICIQVPSLFPSHPYRVALTSVLPLSLAQATFLESSA